MKDTMHASLLYLLIALAFVSGWLYLSQPGMVFYPYRQLDATPAQWGMDYEDVSFRSSDGTTLHGWYIPVKGGKQALLFLHGNAGNISHRGDSVKIFHRLGFNVLIIDYRGYGYSTGKPGENGVYADAEAAWNYLLAAKGFHRNQVVVFGRSLGGSVAAWLSAKVQPAALIMESTFSSSRVRKVLRALR